MTMDFRRLSGFGLVTSLYSSLQEKFKMGGGFSKVGHSRESRPRFVWSGFSFVVRDAFTWNLHGIHKARLSLHNVIPSACISCIRIQPTFRLACGTE